MTTNLAPINEAAGVLVMVGILVWALAIVVSVLRESHREAGMIAVAWLIAAMVATIVCVGMPTTNGLDLLAEKLAQNLGQNMGGK